MKEYTTLASCNTDTLVGRVVRLADELPARHHLFQSLQMSKQSFKKVYAMYLLNISYYKVLFYMLCAKYEFIFTFLPT
jgi:hypothetical protein